MNDVISLFSNCLTACADAPPKQRYGRKEAYGGNFWSKDVPVARSTVLKVLKYATDKERFVFQGNWASLVGLHAMDDGLVASVTSEVMGRKVTASLTIGYGNDLERQLFTGEWTRIHSGRLLTADVRVFPTKLLPTVTATSFGAIVSLKAGVRRRRLPIIRWMLGEWQSLEVQGFRITPEWGEVLTDSDSFDAVTPRLVWRDA